MLKFHLEQNERPYCTIISFHTKNTSIGSIMLDHADSDLIPYIQDMIDAFNAKYIEEPPATKTGGNAHSGGDSSSNPS